MAKSINVMLALKDQFTSPLLKAQKGTKQLDRELKKASNQAKKFGESVKKGMVKAAKATAIGLTAVTAAAGLFAKQSIDAAKVQLKVEKTLETNMKRTTNATDKQIQSVKNLASALQNEGVIGDEVALAGAARLAVYKLNNEQINKLLPNLEDMIAHEKGFNGTQEDSIAMADAIGKALDGKVKGLLKYGVALTDNEQKLFKTMTQEQRLNLISSKLTKSIGGTNKALRETDEGKIVAAKNAWGDMQEELGKKLLPHLGTLASWFESKIPQIQNLILSIADKVQEMVLLAQPYIAQISDIASKMWDKAKPAVDMFVSVVGKGIKKTITIISWLVENWERVSPVIYTVVGALTAYNVATAIKNNKDMMALGIYKAKAAWETLQLIMTGKLTIAQWALNAAMTANPIGLVVGAIAVLVGAIWLAYKNFDKIKAFMSSVWDTISNAVSSFCNVLKGVFIPIWDGVIDAINAILHPIDSAKKALGGIMDKVKGFFGGKKDITVNTTENKTTNTTTTTPRHALGTSYFAGGVTGINEGGRGETAVLPAGTQILSHEQSKKANQNVNIEVNLTIQGNVIGNEQYMEQTGDYIANKLRLAINNM